MTPAACGVALLLLFGAPPPPTVVRLNTSDPANTIEARAELDSSAVRLSGEVRLTLTVEGPGPLGVTVPKPLLTRPGVWRNREDGLPLREVLPGGRERWVQSYRLSPLIPGEPKVSLGPLTIRPAGGNDLTLTWDEDHLPAVKVTTSIESPSVESLRPPTDIEQLPPDPPIDDRSTGWLFALVPGLLLASALLILFGRRKQPPPTPRDAAWAMRELTAANVTADRTAVVLRQYLAYRFGIPAGFQTTPELAAALGTENRMPPEGVADWRSLLEECDAARFSGMAATVAGLADRARALVARAEPAAAGEETLART